MRWVKILFFSMVLSAVNAGAEINMMLQADDKATVQSEFDVQIHLSGTETVGSFTLAIRFDKDKVQITNVSADADGVVTPNQNTLVSVNNNGEVTVGYASTTGFIPGSDKKVVTISCEAKAEGSAYFEIATGSALQNSVIPPQDITGTVENKTVIIISNSFTKEELSQYIADYNTANNKNFVAGVAGDISGNEKLGLEDVIRALQVLSGK